jgi:phosphopantetheine--protein transferase-like protein
MIMETYLADTAHMREILKKPKFLSKVYSPQEMKFIMSKNFSPYIMAEMYCAKLAFKKAMGASFIGCSIQDVSVLADYSGTYYLSFSGEIKKRFTAKKMHSYVSCAHTKIVTMATVMLHE